MNNNVLSFFLFRVGSLLFILLPFASNAFDLDAALAIYQEEIYQPQKNTREYYQKKWLEQQTAQTSQENAQEQSAPEADDLFMAAETGNTQEIARLIAQGLDINISNSERETALHMAAARGHYSTVIYLVNNGAHSTARTVKNWTPLHHAVRFRHHNIANFLIQRGSPIGEMTSDGLTAIDMARNVNDRRLLSILGSR